MEREKLNTVSKGKVKKKSAFKKIAENVSQDGDDIKDYIVKDVLFPSMSDVTSSIIDCIGDVIQSYIDLALFGETRTHRKSKKSKSSSSVSYIQYDDFSKPKKTFSKAKRLGALDDIVFDTYDDAYEVLEACQNYLARFGMVSLGDFFDAAGEKAEHTYYDYGWTSLDKARIDGSKRTGYFIKLPKPQELVD